MLFSLWEALTFVHKLFLHPACHSSTSAPHSGSCAPRNLHFVRVALLNCRPAECLCVSSLCGMADWRGAAQIALSVWSIAVLSQLTGGGEPLRTAQCDGKPLTPEWCSSRSLNPECVCFRRYLWREVRRRIQHVLMLEHKRRKGGPWQLQVTFQRLICHW